VKETQALKERQETPDSPEALTCMPSLQVRASMYHTILLNRCCTCVVSAGLHNRSLC
jgi:hypothetical protein